MALLQKLKEIQSTKENYKTLQKRFYGELKKRFPHIMTTDMAVVANNLQEELHYLLCASLRYKSIPIRLTHLPSESNHSYMNVQRNSPGFFLPFSKRDRSDMDYMNMELYLDKDDIWEKEPGRPKRLYLQLSELKNIGKRMIPDKLDAYFKLLREVMAYRKKFLCYTTQGRKNKIYKKFVIDDYYFIFFEQSFEMFRKITKEEEIYYNGWSSSNNFRYEQSNDDVRRLTDYSESYNPRFDGAIHNRLKFFINNHKEILSKLEKEELEKRKVFKNCNAFLKQIRVHTVPFKVLKEFNK